MTTPTAKKDLHHSLQSARAALLWKLEGLSEYDVRRPMVRTGTNLLGLVKHMAGVEAEYFGGVFRRPFEEPLPWTAEDAEPNADMWATADESREQLIELYRRVGRHADSTIEDLELTSVGSVPWWPEEHRRVTLHRVLVHVGTEAHRHAGQADIIRELIDGTAGLRRDNDNLAPGDEAWWAAYRQRVESAATAAAERPS